MTGRVLDGDGRPVRRQLVEVWQANAGGRYLHQRDQHPAPLDPHFTGMGRCLTDDDGRYAFTTIKPGPYPWRNHHNAWRPAHIHFSVFGTDFTQRLVTQMYFPGDPLFALDPIYQSILDPAARERLVATYDHDLTRHEWATGYRWDIVLTGTRRTPLDLRHRGDLVTHAPSPGQTVGPFFHFALPYDGDRTLVAPARPGRSCCTASCYDGRGSPVPDALVEVWQADPDGNVVQRPGSLRRDGFTFTGFGRCATDASGRYSFSTAAPGGVDGGLPFFAIAVLARGLLHRLLTRAYLPLSPGAHRPGAHRSRRPSRDPGLRRGRRRAALRHPTAGRRRDGLPHHSGRLSP